MVVLYGKKILVIDGCTYRHTYVCSQWPYRQLIVSSIVLSTHNLNPNMTFQIIHFMRLKWSTFSRSHIKIFANQRNDSGVYQTRLLWASNCYILPLNFFHKTTTNFPSYFVMGLPLVRKEGISKHFFFIILF
jgi:hypothetical protein